MLVFFRCVAEAIAAKGARGLLEMVPGGGFAYDVAEDALHRLRQRRQADQLRQEVLQVAQASLAAARAAADQAVAEARIAPADAPRVAQYLAGIPNAVRQSLKRPEDPSGRSAPANFALRDADELVAMLPPRPPRFQPGDAPPVLHGWALEELLGAGGFGEVWKARHPRLTGLVGAVKFTLDLNDRERALLHEGDLLSRLMAEGRHPGIVPLQDAHLDDTDTPWLRFEYVAGGDLADAIRAWAALPVEQRQARALACLRHLAETVGHFHRLSPPIVHRDLKPSNILLDRAARTPPGDELGFVPRIADFGIGGVVARRAITQETRGGATRGGRLLSHLRGSHTPLYASPQQREGGDPDPRDDVHALGVIAYQMLTGQLHLGPSPDMAEELAELGVDARLITAITRCVTARPERRCKDGDELCATLAGPLGQAGVKGPKENTPREMVRPHRADEAAEQHRRDEAKRKTREETEALARREAEPTPAEVRRQAEADRQRGEAYFRGKGVAQDHGAAMRFYRKAAELGDANSQFMIGHLYHNGLGVRQDHAEALRWYRLAADQGYGHAQNNIGAMYQHGLGVRQDHAEALRWYRLAADQGCVPGGNNLGFMYQHGLGVKQDYAKALHWFRLAADQGYAIAQYNLGFMYQHGLGVPANQHEAIAWYRKAASQHNQEAVAALNRLGVS